MSAATRSSTNGSTDGRATARAVSAEPIDRILGLDQKSVFTAFYSVAVAASLHVTIAIAAVSLSLYIAIRDFNRSIRMAIGEKLSQTYDVEKVEEPPPPKEEPKAEEPPPPAKTEDKVEEPTDTPPAPPAAAQAGAILTQEPKDEPVDLTGNAMVVGTSTAYAGGVTQQNGTSTTAVRNANAVATGVPGGTGTAPTPAPGNGPDRSRPAGLLGSADWSDCPFPPEADAEQIDQAFVTLQVTVAPDGKPSQVTVVQDPGHGFGREARRCALRKRYNAALDREGNALGGATKPFRVRFDR